MELDKFGVIKLIIQNGYIQDGKHRSNDGLINWHLVFNHMEQEGLEVDSETFDEAIDVLKECARMLMH